MIGPTISNAAARFRRIAPGLVALAAAWLLPPSVHASRRPRVSQPTRYALVIGNNQTPGRVRLDRAEAEAQHLGEQLVRYARFDVKRVSIVTGGFAGEFLIEYLPSGLVERFHKRPNRPLEVAVHSGAVALRALSGEDEEMVWKAELRAGDTLVLRPQDIGKGASATVFEPQEAEVSSKGLQLRVDSDIVRRPRSDKLYVGINYRRPFLGTGYLSATQIVGVDLTWVTDTWLASVGAGYGRTSERFSTWGYHLDALVLTLESGLSWTGASWRTDVIAGGELAIDRVQYESGWQRGAFGWGTCAGARWWTSAFGIAWTANATVVARSLVGAAQHHDDRQWSYGSEVGVGARWAPW